MQNKIYNFKSLLVILLYCCCCRNAVAQAPSLAWTRQMGGPDEPALSYLPSESGTALTRDRQGNIYTTGYFSGTADFDPGTGTASLSAAGGIGIYISKLDPSGNFLWARKIDGAGDKMSTSLATDATGNVYLTGYFDGSTDFDPGAGTFMMNGVNYDIFILKLSASGNFIRAQKIGGDGFDMGVSAVTDTAGYLYLSGGFGDVADFDPGPGTTSLVCSGGASDMDLFVAKMDTAGHLVWAVPAGGPDGWDISNALSVDNAGNVYTTGYFTGTADFDPGAGTQDLTSAGYDDIFVMKLDSAGHYVWARQLGGDGLQEYGNAIATDAAGNVYTTGRFSSTVDFDPGPGVYNMSVPSNNGSHIFVSKLNASGNFVWARQIGTNDPSNMGMNEGFAIRVDALSNVYTAGNFGGVVDFDPGSGPADTFNLYSPIDYDAYISKLDSAGHFAWALQFGANDFTAEVIKGMDMDAAGNIYTTGYFNGMSDFDPGPDTAHLYSFGYSDIFINKLATCNTFDTLTQLACDHFSLNGQTYTQSGTYLQHFLSAQGCDSMLLLQLTINTQAPDASVTRNGATLTATASGVDYQWLDCGNGYSAIAGATGQSFTAAANGSYAVAVSRNTCSDTSACFTVTGLGITAPANVHSLKIYPNPTDGKVTLEADHPLRNAALQLTNVVGQVLLEERTLTGRSFTVDLGVYPAGVYMLVIREGTAEYRTKLVRN